MPSPRRRRPLRLRRLRRHALRRRRLQHLLSLRSQLFHAGQLQRQMLHCLPARPVDPPALHLQMVQRRGKRMAIAHHGGSTARQMQHSCHLSATAAQQQPTRLPGCAGGRAGARRWRRSTRRLGARAAPAAAAAFPPAALRPPPPLQQPAPPQLELLPRPAAHRCWALQAWRLPPARRPSAPAAVPPCSRCGPPRCAAAGPRGWRAARGAERATRPPLKDPPAPRRSPCKMRRQEGERRVSSVPAGFLQQHGSRLQRTKPMHRNAAPPAVLGGQLSQAPQRGVGPAHQVVSTRIGIQRARLKGSQRRQERQALRAVEGGVGG